MKIIDEKLCCIDSKILIGRNTVNYLEKEIKKRKTLIVAQKTINIDKIVENLEGEIYEIILEGGEKDKELETALNIVDYLYKKEFQRSDYVLAVGGGTLTDVVGFAASIYMRGIKLINIPTTLLGMVDAAIGGKNGVNFRGVKNIVGTFYNPHIVIIDLNFLDTLPEEEYLNGLAEVVKYGVVLDKTLFNYLIDHADDILSRNSEAVEYIIYKSVLNKLDIVKEDPYETKNIRIILNFGHTIGHAIESASKFTVSHGKAVAVGMVIESMIGVDIGITDIECSKSLIDILKKYRLPTSLNELSRNIDAEILFEAVDRDKKRYRNSISLPIPIRIGMWTKIDVDVNEIKKRITKWIG